MEGLSECFAALSTASLESGVRLCHAGNVKTEMSISGECLSLSSARCVAVFPPLGLRVGSEER